ncbi:MAG TPA: PEP-CTERM sorting domain-containing protein, partial [Pirellulales bacterium]
GYVTASDISAMEGAITDPHTYETANGFTDAQLTTLGDVNGDDAFTLADLQQLLINLKNGGSSTESVPEPSAWLMAAIGLCCVAATRRLADRRARNCSRS